MNSPKAVEEGNLTFKRVVNEGEKQTPVTASISKEDQETLAYFQSLRQAFTESELLQVLEILSTLSHGKENIEAVLDLLQGEQTDEEQSESSSQDSFKIEGSY